MEPIRRLTLPSRCPLCGQYTRAYTTVRISTSEMESYYHLLGMCRLTAYPNEIMQQEIRPLLAVDIIEQLHRQFAVLSGGRGKDGAPIITFPEYSGFSEVPDEDFLNVVTYLTSIPSLDAASIGFIIIIDRRKDKWSAVKASLNRIAGAFPGNLQLVLVLRPSRFFQRAIADIGIKLHKDDFKMKIVMLNSVSDLHNYVDRAQLTRELGGHLDYCHSQWIHHRTAIENFAVTVKSTAQMLQSFGTDLAETELPNDVQCTKDMLLSHTDKHNQLKDELKLALKQGTTLLGCIKEQAGKSECRKLNPDEMENQTTVERLLAQLDETENAFEQFWCKHHLKLEQCLQLRHFEQDFREVKVSLDSLLLSLGELPDTGDCVVRVEQLLKELKALEEKAQVSLEKAQLHAQHGDQLIQSDHYAVDSIRPKCVELRRICDDFSNENQRKQEVLTKSLQILQGIDKVNQWCESGIYLLASQAVDKCQSQEGAESALSDIENFLDSAQKNQLTELRNLHNQNEMVLSEELKASVLKALKRLEDVQEMFEKRNVSLKRLSAKQTRPVQPVAPRPESSPKRPSLRNTRSTGGQQPLARRLSDNTNNGKPPVDNDPNKKKNIRKAKGGIKIEVMHEGSQGGSTQLVLTNETEESLSNRRRHIMTELIETERLYVEELQSIMEVKAQQGHVPFLLSPCLVSLIDCKRPVLPYFQIYNAIFSSKNISGVVFCFIHTRDARIAVTTAVSAVNPRVGRMGYYSELDNSELSHLIPPSLENKRDVLFGNLPEIYEFHNKTFRGELENCAEKPEVVGTCFLKRKEELKVYEKYCQNKPRSEVLWRQCGDSLFFQECQKKLDHKLSLDAYLLKPVQRITKYQLMLKEMLKCSKGEGCAELEEALATVVDIIKSVNDSMHQIAITGYEGNLSELGKLLMQGSFNVWTDHKKGHSKVKDLARFKPMQRHLFLYDKTLLFCKKREETSEGHEKSPSYSFKHSLKMSSVGITENVKGDMKKFEVWFNGREEVYIIQAPSMDVKNMWVSEIRKVLQGQLEACREASHQKFSDNIYGGPIRNVKKMALRQSDSSSPESGFKRTNPSPNTRQKRSWTQRRLPSMDTEDFETIPSSAEESSNSSEEEGSNKNGDSSRYRVQLTYESRDPRDLSLDSGEMVQFLEEAENGQ
ncbi:guanine nucleotide exchange factor DBS [Boleophthalmus pectinirostris]|uniref:guanine nucleotide exchange factor DBS n=1 Tax=Boleophthalmus pectinirostris TaxID=150288 RepID=UPI00242BC10D|nr:guanine nucleotide exchange factor DBS [Boleophthalmus pectinirostris]